MHDWLDEQRGEYESKLQVIEEIKREKQRWMDMEEKERNEKFK